MKKLICSMLLIITGITAVNAGEFDLSAGAGGLLGGFFTRYTLAADGMVDGDRIKIDAIQKMNQLNYGFFAFFDATYGVFSVYYQNGVNNWEESFDIDGLDNSSASSGQGWDSYIGLSLMGKYPFKINERVAIFPMMGIDYQISLKQRRTQPNGWVYDRDDGYREKDKDGNAYKLEDWNSLWINLGGGMDFMLVNNFFIRSELLYSFRLMTPYEIKNLEMMKSMAGDPNPKLGGLTSGPSLRLSAGYRFFNKNL